MATKNLAAGLLKHRILFQRQISTINSAGENVIEWEDYAERWAQIEDLSGNQLLLAQQVQSEVRTRIRVRQDPQIIPSMRGLWRSFVYDIKAVRLDPDSGLEFQWLECASGLNAG